MVAMRAVTNHVCTSMKDQLGQDQPDAFSRLVFFMNLQELVVVAKRVHEWKNPRCWAWREGYRLPLTQALQCPEYG